MAMAALSFVGLLAAVETFGLAGGGYSGPFAGWYPTLFASYTFAVGGLLLVAAWMVVDRIIWWVLGSGAGGYDAAQHRYKK